MSYGSVQGVADLSTMYTTNGSFSASTKPTTTVVSGWLDSVSSMLDSALADEGFVTPITDTDITPTLDLLVEGITKDIVDYSHRAGRYFTKQALDAGISPFIAANKELREWVKDNSIGLEAQGAAKNPDFSGRNTASFVVI